MQISKAKMVARKAIESLYDSTATIYTFQSVRDEDTGQMKTSKIPFVENHPCRISSKTDNQAMEQEMYENKKQIVKLFIAPEISIPIGSKIEISKNENTKKYCNSGEPMVYDTHQEVLIEKE